MALISSGFGIGVAVGMAVDVEVAVGVGIGAGIKAWVDGAVGDESEEAELVPVQAERMSDNIHKTPRNFVLFIDDAESISRGLPRLIMNIILIGFAPALERWRGDIGCAIANRNDSDR